MKGTPRDTTVKLALEKGTPRDTIVCQMVALIGPNTHTGHFTVLMKGTSRDTTVKLALEKGTPRDTIVCQMNLVPIITLSFVNGLRKHDR